MIRRCTWTGPRMNHYSATRRSLLRTTGHDDSSGGPSDSFLVAVAAPLPVMWGAYYRPFRCERSCRWTAIDATGSCPTGDRKLRALGKATLAGILGG
jgi:hypothetical protein